MENKKKKFRLVYANSKVYIIERDSNFIHIYVKPNKDIETEILTPDVSMRRHTMFFLERFTMLKGINNFILSYAKANKVIENIKLIRLYENASMLKGISNFVLI